VTATFALLVPDRTEPSATPRPPLNARSPGTLTKPRMSWGVWYFKIFMALLAISLPAAWIFTGYYGYGLSEGLSFFADDGWCQVGTESMGVHCFGDFAALYHNISSPDLWNPKSPLGTPYPPSSLLPGRLATWVGSTTGGFQTARDLYLASLAMAMLVPAVWVAWGRFWSTGPYVLVILGLGTAPFLIVMDRGNSTGFVVAPLMLSAIFLVRRETGRMAVMIAICALLKPQFLVLLLLLLAYRKYRQTLLTLLSVGTLSLLSFVVSSNNPIASFKGWLEIVGRYSGYQSVEQAYPYNLSLIRSVMVINDSLHAIGRGAIDSATRTSLAEALVGANQWIATVVLVVVVVVVWTRGRRANPVYLIVLVLSVAAILPGVSYAYYLCVFTVPLALVLKHPETTSRHVQQVLFHGLLDTNAGQGSRLGTVSTGFFLALLALLMVPLFIPIDSIGSTFIGSSQSASVGLVQSMWGVALVLLFAISLVQVARPQLRRL
jgi:hypothetical protein